MAVSPDLLKVTSAQNMPHADFYCNKRDLALAPHQKKYKPPNLYQHLEIEYWQCLHEKFTYMKVYRIETRTSQGFLR